MSRRKDWNFAVSSPIGVSSKPLTKRCGTGTALIGGSILVSVPPKQIWLWRSDFAGNLSVPILVARRRVATGQVRRCPAYVTAQAQASLPLGGSASANCSND